MLRSAIAAAAMIFALPVAAEPVRLAVTDIEGLEALQQEFSAFEKALEDTTGLDIELFPVSSRTSAVESMNQNKVDLVLTGPAEYVVMKELTNAEIVVAWQRPNYFAQIVVMAEGEIDGPQDLKGKTVTFGSVGSTSQHLGPAQVLADFGLAYGTDYTAQIISRNVAIEALIRGDVQAVGMNDGHLRRIRDAFPGEAFKVIARGRDLPNDILVARPDMDRVALEKIKTAFLENSGTLMAAVLKGEDNQKYGGGFFLTGVNDENYNYVRDMYQTIGVDTSSFVGD
ncbi:PhnD/SsuA/transferrin family substrate-binding protein [Roseibium alexandrii]|uniref:ABC-type phosphate/phosphonate transport system, periplasmic component n=1 Tax=Roseibium alexandrii (strain DSM 17067 / NCIMB 14079 / DFL-11) TaxID=244592 RepID=A0A5E8H4Q1_ROSAD|nr:PhnD/SsuA/transferrin family substrate-binding protein [Roseibium alexandrii]EEE47677.1 ABC-type phosphate/phosphonate transport system, periplasmic component [Roseibium alexandrii DFL-11]